jgi:hypothetical protein
MSKAEAMKALLDEKMLDNNIVQYFHCGLCLDELPAGLSPSDYQQNEGGWTKDGFQVWCKRHDCNVIHMDFEGAKHPAFLERKPTPEEARAYLQVAEQEAEKPQPAPKPPELSDEETEARFDAEVENCHKRIVYTLERFHPVVGDAVLPMATAEVLMHITEGDTEKALEEAKDFQENLVDYIKQLGNRTPHVSEDRGHT